MAHVVALAEHGSFAQAAEAVHLSQPAFSRSIQSLEEDLGVELFNRGQRKITPTAYGKLVVDRGQRVLAEATSLQRDVKRMRAHEFGEIAFGLGPIPAAVLLEPILTRSTRDHPGIRTRVEITHWRNLLKLLEIDELDFFIGDIRELVSSDRLVIDPLPEFHIGMYARRNHPALSVQPISPRELLRFLIGSFKLPDISLAEFTQWLEFEGDPKTLFAVQCDNMGTLERVAIRSDLIVVGPQLSFREAIANQLLVEIELNVPLSMTTHMGVVRMRERMLAPGAELLIGMAFEALTGGPEEFPPPQPVAAG
ncbi:LysR family transcriptional regulator [Bradyrhizobium sp.]|uniref:LysR family transcriptional regulator n=1 Tax=Bradyrhizobium sp. TaxID=376 RepID=UPI0025B98BA7|nr:LysR family transcriptional regulator [Bradyrhizobium sp.]